MVGPYEPLVLLLRRLLVLDELQVIVCRQGAVVRRRDPVVDLLCSVFDGAELLVRVVWLSVLILEDFVAGIVLLLLFLLFLFSLGSLLLLHVCG